MLRHITASASPSSVAIGWRSEAVLQRSPLLFHAAVFANVKLIMACASVASGNGHRLVSFCSTFSKFMLADIELMH